MTEEAGHELRQGDLSQNIMRPAHGGKCAHQWRARSIFTALRRRGFQSGRRQNPDSASSSRDHQYRYPTLAVPTRTSCQPELVRA
jgi:hypothetical protein